MAVAPKNVDINLVRKLIPFDTLSIDKVEEVLSKAALQKIPAGKVLFKQGDKDKWTVYLLSGEIELDSGSQKNIVKAGSEAALKPLAQGVPRTHTATSKTEVSILIIDTELLNVLINYSPTSSIEVSDFTEEDDDDWMTRFLQSNAFIRLPASNMQALLIKLEEVPLTKGKIVIREGDTEDQNYYIIKQGQCIVSRLDPATGKQKPLAILESGTGFGEEALITGTERGATVSMKTDGIVMKLDKNDFIELLVKPLIHIISKSQIKALGDTNITYVDVRSKIEHEKNGIEGSINLPIRIIREHLPKLDPDSHYIVYSNSENRSSSAAFLFIQQGLEVSVLRDGVGRPDLSDEEIRQSMLSAEFSQPPAEVADPAPQSTAIESQTAKTSDGEHDIAYYKQKLEQSEQARTRVEASLSKLKLELEKMKKVAQKDTQIARNAIALLKKSEARIKNLEAEIQKLKASQ